MRLCELREKDVINVCNCECLGFVVDIDIDVCTGVVLALIIPGCGKMWSMFGRGSELLIPWSQVVRVGPDIILVEIPEPEPK